MKPVRIYRHDKPVGAGYFIEFLKQQNFEYDLVALDQGEVVDLDISNTSALVFLGGDASVNDEFSWIDDEISLIQLANKQNFPIFGHCFGAQLISKALGGEITQMPRKEIGWFTLNMVQNAITQEWFGHIQDEVQALHWHAYSLTIPKGATPLFGTSYCSNQAFVWDNVVATTAHVEVTPKLLQQWVDEYRDELMPASSTVQTEAEITKDLANRVKDMQRVTDVLYKRWLDMVKQFHT